MGALDTVQMPFQLRAWPTTPQITGAVPQMSPPVANIVPTQVPSILANAKDPIAEIGSGLLSAVSAFSPQEKEKRALEKLKLDLETQKSQSDIRKLDLENRLLESMMGSKAKAQDIANAATELDNNLKQMQLQKSQWESGNWGSDAALSNEEKITKIKDLNSQIEQRQQQQQMVSGALANIGKSMEGPSPENVKVVAQLPGGKTLTQVTYDETEPVEMAVGGIKVPVGSRTVKKTKIMETGEEVKAPPASTITELADWKSLVDASKIAAQKVAKLKKSELGPMDTMWRSAFGGTPEYNDAIQSYNAVRNVILRLRSGGAVTPAEADRLLGELGKPSDLSEQRFVENVNSFAKQREREYQKKVDALKTTGYKVPELDMLKDEEKDIKTENVPKGIKVTSKAEYDALPSGTTYTSKDPETGKWETYIKK